MRRQPLQIAVTWLVLLAAVLLGAPAESRAQTLADIVAASKQKQASLTAPTDNSGASGSLGGGLGASGSLGQALFGSREFRNASLKGLPQWQQVIRRMSGEAAGFEACARDASQCTTPPQKSWRQLIQKAAGESPREQLRTVNSFLNRWPYKEDRELYGVSEYWATPAEFLRRAGDCEDYAIAKFFALRHLGFAAESVRIVILWDEIRAAGHAVTAVYTGGEILILDNLSDMVVPHSRYKHYIPQYSMTESARWAHIHKKKIPTLLASTSAGPLTRLAGLAGGLPHPADSHPAAR